MGMPKGKLGRIIWRKIGGRIIPIKISNFADKSADSVIGLNKHRKIVATLPTGKQIGKMTIAVPKKGISAEVISVNVEKEFQKKGISKNLFHRAASFLERVGKKFLNSGNIQHHAQLKIRHNFGVGHSIRVKGMRDGKLVTKYKSRTRYIADQFGVYGDESRIVKKDTAIDFLKNDSTGRQIKASTMISNINKLRKKK